MSMNTIAYPFDPTGVAVSNRVVGERQVLTPGDWKEHFFLIPLAAPYFGDSLQLIHHPSETVLEEGVDYAMTHRFHDASLSCGKSIFGSITLYDKTLTGILEFQYQTLGGVWTQNQQQILNILANKLVNPRITTWEQVANIPYAFPVIDHEWDLVDMVGMSAVVEQIHQVALAIQNRQSGGLQEHIDDTANPHETTKAQVGLGNVPNYSIANTTEAEQGILDDRFMSPLKTRQAILLQAVAPLNLHIDDRDNPHEVTRAQVGLGNVANFGLADINMARAGMNNASYMTPLTTAASVDQFAVIPLNEFIARRDNPHQVSKAQVGLGNVQNYPTADNVVAQQGVSTSHYMTPAATRIMIDALAGENFSNHVNNLDNPHQTNKTQVGLGNVQNYAVATQQQAEDGALNDVYMTPLRTAQYVAIAIDGAIDSHANDVNNPHLTTKAQVGLGNVENYAVATQQQAIDGVSNTTYMSPQRTREAFDAWGGGGGSGDLQLHLDDLANPHQVTAAQVGAYTTGQVDSLLIGKLGTGQTAYDSTRFGGMTVTQFRDSLSDLGGGGTGLLNFEADATTAPTWTYFGSTPFTQPIVFTVYGSASEDDAPVAVLCEYAHEISNVPNVKVLSGDLGALELGFVVDSANSEIDFYLKAPGPRPAFTVHPTYYGTGFIDATAVVQTSEPANYQAFANFTNHDNALIQRHGRIGEMIFADADGYNSGNVIEEVNVVQSIDTAIAELREKPWYEMFDEMSTLHFYKQGAPLNHSSDRTRRAAWYCAASQNYLEFSDTPQGYLRGLYSVIPREEYTVEVAFASTDADMQSGLGICAALVERNGRYYSIDIVRTPGGMISETHPGSAFFELITVGLNLFRNDTADLGSLSAGQVWGDAVVHEDRGTAGPFTPTGNGWSGLGYITIKVVKTSTQIDVYVSAPNDTVPVTPTLTIDLTTPALSALFGSRPTKFGIIASPNATTFDATVLNAPDHFRPYITLGAGDNYLGSTYSYHNGQSWVSTSGPSTNLPYVNRLVHSEMDGTIWKVGRSGAMKQMYVAVSAPTNQTVYTQ